MTDQDQAPEPTEADRATDDDGAAGDEVRGLPVAPDADPQELVIDTHVAQDEPDLDGDGQPG